MLSTVSARVLTTIEGVEVPIPDPDRLIHLQFRRFAGCPVCSLHLRSIVSRHREIIGAGITEVVVFHSSAMELRKYTADLPLHVIADPDHVLYREFGVESGAQALLDPHAWSAIARGVTQELRAVRYEARPMPPRNPEGGRFGLPADYLIASDGKVLAAKHGAHADDQWSVDELLTQVPAERTVR
ncbi:peroxiredoxin-like family protein [Nocardia alni]|uniref:peroxiredoxin-like family protein n=1 Tax=Nocardia alni TaxID=2815723 RepID=UPI001C233173|nr:peroxiredoxin-like family protein [Nocardia alni]